MEKKTAVEWLQECLSIHLTYEQKMQFEGLYHQALAIEKEQIVRAFGYEEIDGEQYYNETYHPVDTNEMIDHIGDANKMVETIYTEEQVKAIVEKSRTTGLTAEYIMLSLKQPKK